MANVALTVPPTAPNKGKATPAPKHPPTAEMVDAAIKSLNERGGSSLYAIKKYISVHYPLDVEKISIFIKKYLKKAVDSGKLKQPKGIGATGSFKLNEAEPKKSATKKSKHVTGEKKTEPKKSPAKKKKPATASGEKKKAAAPAKAASPKKAGKVSKEKSTKPKAAAVKVKAPKPKKAASPAKKAVPKKAVPKKTAEPKKK